MLSRVPEQKMHSVRLILTLGWFILIFSLFYDPISHYLTDPNHLWSPFRDANACVLVQGKCLETEPYPMGTRIFWGMVVPSAIFIVLVFGHETWRRICPLYFLSQIPRRLGFKPKLNIRKNLWLEKYHLYLQFSLLFLGLNARILFINSNRLLLGLFLILTIFAAMLMVFLYGGRSWCHYVCPFGVVQMVFTGPQGLLGSAAYNTPKKMIPQSECRVFDHKKGVEKSACVGCKSHCIDKDAEKSYWHSLTHPGRRFVQYGYLGLVLGYFVYYGLYAGNFDYYFSGVWTHETNQLSTIFNPGFFIFNKPLEVPKIVACPLTLGFFVLMSYWTCSQLEKAYRSLIIRRSPWMTREQVLHQVFSVCTFLAFNIFFIYGGRPEILRLSTSLQLMFSGLIAVVSSLWLYRSWNRTVEKYNRESLTESFRRQLQKLPVDFFEGLDGFSLEQLTTDELYILAKVLPKVTRKDRLKVYRGVLQDVLEQGYGEAAFTLDILESIRQQLGLSNDEHYQVLTQLGGDFPHLIYPQQSLLN